MLSRSSVWPAKWSTMVPWPSATRPGARWRSGGTVCGSSAMRLSGGTGRMPGRRPRPRSRSSALLRRGNRQPGWRGRLPFWMSVIPAGSSPTPPLWRRRRRAVSRAFPARPARSRRRARAAGLARPVAVGPGGSSAARCWTPLSGMPASALTGRMPIRSASAGRSSPSYCPRPGRRIRPAAAGHPGGPGIPSRNRGNGSRGCPAPGHDGAGQPGRPARSLIFLSDR